MSGDSKISVALATAVGLGAIIGAGIFVLSGTAIALAGSDAILAFIIVGIVALMIALQLGELGSIMPEEKGASYSYVYKAFGSELGFITGIILYFSYATSISAIALGFGSYAASLFGINVAYFARYFSIAIITLLAVVNLLGIKKAVKADFALVVVKIFILLVFVAFAFYMAFTFSTPHSIGIIGGSIGGLSGIFAASVAIFFAYSGFQSISTFTSRVRSGAAGAAKAILYSVIISIFLYVLVIIALLLLLPSSSYAINADPLSYALSAIKAPGVLQILVGIGALIATASATLAMILTSSRILHQISSNHLLPRYFMKYNNKTDVAVNGIIISSVIGIIFLFAGNIYIIAAIANFGLLFSYLMGSFALMHFRRIKRFGTLKSPFYPYLPILTIIALMLFMFGMPQESLVIGVLLILSLIIVYYFLRETRLKKVIRIKLF